MYNVLCNSRKHPYPPQPTEIPRGGQGGLKAQCFKKKYNPKLEFQEGWGRGFKLKNLPWIFS